MNQVEEGINLNETVIFVLVIGKFVKTLRSSVLFLLQNRSWIFSTLRSIFWTRDRSVSRQSLLHRNIQTHNYSSGGNLYASNTYWSVKYFYITELYLMVTAERETRSARGSHAMNTHCVTGTWQCNRDKNARKWHKNRQWSSTGQFYQNICFAASRKWGNLPQLYNVRTQMCIIVFLEWWHNIKSHRRRIISGRKLLRSI